MKRKRFIIKVDGLKGENDCGSGIRRDKTCAHTAANESTEALPEAY